jgi:L-cysteine desulfidase
MKISPETIQKVLKILDEEIIPAEGCTEPIAIAYAASLAAFHLNQEPHNLKIFVSGNILKNVKSVVVPNSGGLTGIKIAAAMGFVAGDHKKELMVISSVTPEDLKKVHAFMDKCTIEVLHEKTDINLYIRIEAFSKDNTSIVEMKHIHTNITKIIKNNNYLINRPCSDADFNSPLTDRKILSIKLIYNLAKSIDLDLIRPLFERVIKFNTAIALEGLKETYGVNIGSRIQKNIDAGIYGDDSRNRCASFAAAGSDARMSGCPLPVMTTCGSGNLGMTASLPVIKYCELKNFTHEETIRALFFSHLASVHIKTNVGRLSAHCGAVCAAAALGGALAFVNNGDLHAVGGAIVNTLGNISGLICDGAKASCAMKIATGIYAAFDSATLGVYHTTLHEGDGIIGKDVEQTITNIGHISRLGMEQTERVILDIMMQ